MNENPIAPFLSKQGFLILDGGLSTQLESQGHDLNHSLWTARMLDENPGALKEAHSAFLQAGADCIISSSYQATPRGLTEAGYTREKAIELIRRSQSLAQECCDAFFGSLPSGTNRLRPIVAGSIGPYGAYLADGSEYRGNYGLSVDELAKFHRERFELLSGISDLLAIETIPSLDETKAMRVLLKEPGSASAWISFSCKDGKSINDGHAIESAIDCVADLQRVVAVGVNCTSPEHVPSLIERIKTCCGKKEIVIYPNAGEAFNATDKTWTASKQSKPIEEMAIEWYSLGARLVGGCCRVRAKDIAQLREAVAKKSTRKGKGSDPQLP